MLWLWSVLRCDPSLDVFPPLVCLKTCETRLEFSKEQLPMIGALVRCLFCRLALFKLCFVACYTFLPSVGQFVNTTTAKVFPFSCKLRWPGVGLRRASSRCGCARLGPWASQLTACPESEPVSTWSGGRSPLPGLLSCWLRCVRLFAATAWWSGPLDARLR